MTNKTLIDKYIAMPMAITVFKHDHKSFESYKNGNLYQDKLDATINKLKADFYFMKKELISQHHLDIKCIDQCRYSEWKNHRLQPSRIKTADK